MLLSAEYRTPCEFKNVLYVNDLKHNLLSVKCVAKAGYKVIFENETVEIRNGEIFIATSCIDRGMYVIRFYQDCESPYSANLINSVYSLNIEIWHKRLCHMKNRYGN